MPKITHNPYHTHQLLTDIAVKAFSKMVDSIWKLVEPLHIFEDPTQKMEVGKSFIS